MRVAFVGLGKLGLPCAEQMAAVYEVIGYDVETRVSDKIRIVGDLGACTSGCDLVFVAIQTPHDPLYDGSTPSSHLPSRDFDYRALSDLLELLNSHVGPSQRVILISTVLPGTLRALLQRHVRTYELIYNPYFIAMGSVAWDMVNPEMVLIGTEEGTLTPGVQAVIDFYRPLMRNAPRCVVGTWEEAEAIKIFYNTFISLKLSFVNMIQDVAERLGHVNVDVVTEALAESSMRITGAKYLRAGMGDAGPCHPRDNIALRCLAERLNLDYDLFGAIMESREVQAMHMAEFLVQQSVGSGLPIVIHGKSYKPGVPYVDGSYSLLVGHYCQRMERSAYYIDPLTGDVAAPELGVPPKGVFLLAHDTRVRYTAFSAGSIIVDPWRQCDPLPGVEIIHYGNTRGLTRRCSPKQPNVPVAT